MALPKKRTIVTGKSFVRRQHSIVDHHSCGGVKKLKANVAHVGGSPGSIESFNEGGVNDNVTSDNINQVSDPNVMKPLVNEDCGVTSENTNHLLECTGSGDSQKNASECGTVPIYNVNTDLDDKFLVSLLSRSVAKKIFTDDQKQCDAFQSWKHQTEFEFGYIPLANLVLPNSTDVGPGFESPIDQHYVVKSYGVPNFLGARSPVISQLNVDVWEELLVDYWDEQLVELIRFGFPLDFNREASLSCDMVNHTSAVQFPRDVDAI